MLLFLPVDPSQLLMEAPCNARSQGPNKLGNVFNIFNFALYSVY